MSERETEGTSPMTTPETPLAIRLQGVVSYLSAHCLTGMADTVNEVGMRLNRLDHLEAESVGVRNQLTAATSRAEQAERLLIASRSLDDDERTEAKIWRRHRENFLLQANGAKETNDAI